MIINDLINKNLNDFEALCKTHHVKKLYAFGSSTNEKFNSSESDIDLLIELNDTDPIERGENLMKIWDKLEVFFQRKVDLLTYNSIKNPFFKKIVDSNKLLIYDVGKKIFN